MTALPPESRLNRAAQSSAGANSRKGSADYRLAPCRFLGSPGRAEEPDVSTGRCSRRLAVRLARKTDEHGDEQPCRVLTQTRDRGAEI